MSVKRLLCCMNSMNAGGAETFLMKQYRKLDREKYQMDFCVNVTQRGIYDDEIEALGGIIYRIPLKSESLIKSLKALEAVVSENGYENVLCSSVKPGTALELVAAKKGGAKRLIYRSSNSSVGDSRKQKLLHSTIGQLARVVPTVKIAPSVVAAEFCFGKGCVDKGKAQILHNGIDTSVYRYSDELRRITRAQLGLDSQLAVIHVGRFSAAKNHSFLLSCFLEILKLKPDAVLFLVGTGELEERVRNEVSALNLSDNVRFLGIRHDVPDLMAAADVFVFPSIFEGMPNTVIEAQALSLACIIADTITPQADITGLVKYLPLSDPSQWAEQAVEKASCAQRRDMTDIIKEQKYDSDTTAREFVRYCFGE